MANRDELPSGSPSTAALIEGYLNGKPRETHRLFEKLRLEVLRHIPKHRLWKRLNRRLDAEDIVQEVLLRLLAGGVLRGIEDRGVGSLMRMVSVILDRTLVDVTRRLSAGKRTPHGSINSLTDAVETPESTPVPRHSAGSTPSADVRADELRERVAACLTSRELQIWEMVGIQGLTCVEVSQRLGTSSSAVRGVLLRVRRRLTEALGEVSTDPKIERQDKTEPAGESGRGNEDGRDTRPH